MTSAAIPRTLVARATLGGAFARERGRLALAVLAIALGVALGYAVALVNRSAVTEFASGMATLSGSADLEVRGPRAGFDEALYPTLARIEGVAVASPVVEVDAQVTGRDETLRVLGIDPFRAAAVTPALIGIADTALDLLAPDALFLSPAAARSLGVHPGSGLTVRVGSRDIPLRVAGLTADSATRYGVMDIAAVQDAFARGGRLTRVDLRLAAGADPAAVSARIARLLPAGVVVATPAAGVDATTRLSRAYRVNLDVLALVALFTGGLLVFSTQALAVARRRPQFALLRTLGLTRRRLQRLVIGEAALIGGAGALLGLPAGYALAYVALTYFASDLGAGFFRGAPPAVTVDLAAGLLFGLLGVGAAIAGSFLPAREAARAAPAAALKAGGGDAAFARLRSPWPGLALFIAGAGAALLPPVADLPLPGYAAIALMIVGTLLLMPRLAAMLLALAPAPRNVPAALAIAQLRGATGQATVGLAAIVASVALLSSMAIMVASFRQSLDDWLIKVLPAEVYLRQAGGGDGAVLSPDDQRKIAALPGVRDVEFLRAQSVVLDSALPRVILLARALDAPLQRLPLVGEPVLPGPDDPPAVWVTETVQDVYGFTPGRRVMLPLAGKAVPFFVAGVWRDYARQQGAILIDRRRYVELTGDRDANDAALWLKPGATADGIRQEIAAGLPNPDRIVVTTSGEVRALSLSIFDRTFAVTYALEAAAVAIGLAGLTSSFGALVLARRREFGMLRHIGMTRRQIAAMLAVEGLAVGGVGLAAGLGLGALISLILIHVVNRQSFHWSMDVAVPWGPLAIFAVTLLALALLATLFAARQAMSDDVTRAVKDDW